MLKKYQKELQIISLQEVPSHLRQSLHAQSLELSPGLRSQAESAGSARSWSQQWQEEAQKF